VIGGGDRRLKTQPLILRAAAEADNDDNIHTGGLNSRIASLFKEVGLVPLPANSLQVNNSLRTGLRHPKFRFMLIIKKQQDANDSIFC
jgi:hypothetical protein